MTEKLHQSLSSIMDGAGDDLELPRLLSAMQASPDVNKELGDKWRRYHLAQGLLRGELRGELRSTSNPKTAQLDISAAVMQQLEDDNINFTDAGAASELVTSTTTSKTAALKIAIEQQQTEKAPMTEKRPERGQWLRSAALAASVALLVITGTQIYNLNQEGSVATPALAAQESSTPITNPKLEASLVASDCQSQLFSGTSMIRFPVEISQRQPCTNDAQAFSPLLNAQQSSKQGITPVSSR